MLGVCDVTRPETLPDLAGWKQAVENVVGVIPTYVVANKADLEEERALTSASTQTVCEPWDWPFRLTSAKTGDGVEEAFQGLVDLVMKFSAFQSGAHRNPLVS